jgi:hypothetical protein
VLAALAIGAIVVGAAVIGGSDSQAAHAAMDAALMVAATTDAAPPPPDAAPGATLVIHVDRDDARIEVDGRFIAEATRQVTVEVDPGDHEIAVTAADGAADRRVVRAGAGARLSVDLELSPDKPAPKKPTPTRRPRPDPQERVRALHAATGKLADQLVAARKDARARQLQAEYLAIPSPYTTSDPARLHDIELQLERIRARLRAASR